MPRPSLRKIELSVLAATVVLAGGLFGFIRMMTFARSQRPHEIDEQILLAFRVPGQPDQPLGPSWFAEAVRDVTALGSASVLVFLTLATVVYLVMIRRGATAAFVALSVAGGQLLGSLLKLGIDRPRPDLVSHLADVHTLSFPSGHAMLSAVTFMTLGAVAARAAPATATRVYLLCLALLATLLVGASRIYLGVHWPSDVLAGWCAGAAWAAFCWLIARWLQSGRVLERSEAGTTQAGRP
jgi:undecaprenyl-diphosphatase